MVVFDKKLVKRISDDGKSWICTVNKAAHQSDLELLKEQMEKKRRQMLWKCGGIRRK